MNNPIYTVGHSNHSIERFIDLLRRNGITAVADVRSYPVSRVNPHFSGRELRISLSRAKIHYVFLGGELGARPRDRSCYVDGQARYDLIAATEGFAQGLQRLIEGSATHSIAMMCAEKDPLTCHRTILVGHHLARRGVEVRHVLADGSVEDGSSAEDRLLRETKTSVDLFRSRADLVAEAFAKRGEKIAYVEGPSSHIAAE